MVQYFEPELHLTRGYSQRLNVVLSTKGELSPSPIPGGIAEGVPDLGHLSTIAMTSSMVDGKQYISPSYVFMHMYVLDGERIPSPISAWAKTMGGFVSSGNGGEIFFLFSV